MKFLLDEGVDVALAAHLREAGHDATTIVYDYERSLEDPAVLALAEREDRILLTSDRGFGALTVLERRSHAGVVVLRPPKDEIRQPVRWLNALLSMSENDLRELVIVSSRTIRVRRVRP